MPDARLDRTRRSLPEGYQFGDAGSDARAEHDRAVDEWYRTVPRVIFHEDGTQTVIRDAE